MLAGKTAINKAITPQAAVLEYAGIKSKIPSAISIMPIRMLTFSGKGIIGGVILMKKPRFYKVHDSGIDI